MAQKNTTQAIALCDKGMHWCSESKALEIFQQIKDLLVPTDAREEKIEPSIKRARKAAAGKTAK